MIGVQTIGRMIRRHVTKRPPDVLIGGDGTLEGCYMARWWVLPRNKRFNIYLHHFKHDDEDRALHDHPWWSVSCLIEGSYYEHVRVPVAKGLDVMGEAVFERHAGDVAFRSATAAHRITLPRYLFEGEEPEDWRTDAPRGSVPCWTIFITGPKAREWGFWCPKGWKPWQEFTGQDHNKTGVGASALSPGCGED